MTNSLTPMPAKMPQNQLSATQNATFGSQNATNSCPLPQAKYGITSNLREKSNVRNIPMAVKTFFSATAKL